MLQVGPAIILVDNTNLTNRNEEKSVILPRIDSWETAGETK